MSINSITPNAVKISPSRQSSPAQSQEVRAHEPETASANAAPSFGTGTPDPGGNVSRAVGEQGLADAVNRLNGLAQTIRRELQFSVDDESGRTIIKVFDSETEELIRQIPPEEVLSLIARMQNLEGGLVQESV